MTRNQILLMEHERDLLLRQHQAIIGAWFASWLERERTRIDAAFNGSALPRPHHSPIEK